LYKGVIGVIDLLQDKKIAVSSDFKNVIILETTGGRIDIIIPFTKTNKIDITRLAVWRLEFGECSWFSDYKKNYADHHDLTISSNGTSTVQLSDKDQNQIMEPVVPTHIWD
jgi:hypothetical protein